MIQNYMLYIEKGSEVKPMERRMKEVFSYIDLCLIDEYKEQDKDGYHLDIESIPEGELETFARLLMNHDTATREFVRMEMQRLIDYRLEEIYDRRNRL